MSNSGSQPFARGLRGLRIWHDDIRKAPDGWIWCRTNQQAMLYLCYAEGPVDEISLDHDLGLHDLDPADYESPEILRGSSEETGRHLVKAMILLKVVPAKVTIHSWNPLGAQQMAEELNYYGYDCTIKPFLKS